jgi:hypothetical protein
MIPRKPTHENRLPAVVSAQDWHFPACWSGLPSSRSRESERDRHPSSAASDSTIGRAEQLFQLAQQRQLDDGLAGEAASLLDDADPFVQGIAEWALATKVNLENNGQEIVWPRPDPPDWYRALDGVGRRFSADADYVRQGAPWGIHHQPASMLGSVDLILKRAAGAFDELLDRTATKPDAKRPSGNLSNCGRSGSNWPGRSRLLRTT